MSSSLHSNRSSSCSGCNSAHVSNCHRYQWSSQHHVTPWHWPQICHSFCQVLVLDTDDHLLLPCHSYGISHMKHSLGRRWQLQYALIGELWAFWELNMPDNCRLHHCSFDYKATTVIESNAVETMFRLVQQTVSRSKCLHAHIIKTHYLACPYTCLMLTNLKQPELTSVEQCNNSKCSGLGCL